MRTIHRLAPLSLLFLAACVAPTGSNDAELAGETSAPLVKLPIPTPPIRFPPIHIVDDAPTVADIQMSFRAIYYVMSDGTVNAAGQTQLTTSNTVVPVPGLSGVAQIAAGNLFGCALLTNGTVQCWGQNAEGELGNGTTTASTTPVAVSGISNAVQISSDGLNACALLATGAVECWGFNGDGELGNGNTTDSSVPVRVAAGATVFTKVAVGDGTVYALTNNGDVEVWGANNQGQFGNGTTTSPPKGEVPTSVPGLGAITAIAGGGDFACALRADATLHCWGANDSGQLGNGTFTRSLIPVQVSLTGVTSIAASLESMCAKNASGVYCWGADQAGELGDGTATDNPSPSLVTRLAPTSGLRSNGAGRDFCALMADGTVDCWGLNLLGQLGNGTTTTSYFPAPVAIP